MAVAVSRAAIIRSTASAVTSPMGRRVLLALRGPGDLLGEIAVLDGRTRSAGKVRTAPEQLELFAASLAPSDRVVLEATGNAWAIARVLEGHVAEVVLAHPKKLRAIAESDALDDPRGD